jgi:hypothetical protein
MGIKRMISGGDAATEWNIVMATAMLAMLPPALVVMLMQKWFVKGLVDTEKYGRDQQKHGIHLASQRRQALRHGPKANQVIHGVNAEIADGEFIVIVGPSGCGKIHAAAHGGRAGGDLRRRDRHRRPRGQPAGAGRARHRHGVPELRAVPAHERVRQHGLRPEDRQGAQGRDQARASTRPPRSWSWATCWSASRASCRAASASAWPWAAPSCASRRSSCSTSRCPTWTPSCARRPGWRSRSCTASWASPRCSSPTTRSRP